MLISLCLCRQNGVNIFGRIATLGNGGHGEVFTTRGTVSTGPDPVDMLVRPAPADGNLSTAQSLEGRHRSKAADRLL